MSSDPHDRRLEELERENAELKRKLEEALGRIKQLEERLRKSQRQAGRFAREKRAHERKKPGRGTGHAYANRPVPGPVNEEIFAPLGCCPHCRGELNGIENVEQFVVDIPEVRPHVQRIVTQRGWCRKCRRRVRSHDLAQSSRAGGAAKVSLGPRAVGMAAELKHRLGVAFRKVKDIFSTYFGLPVSHGALVQQTARLATRAEPTYRALIGVVRGSPAVHTDDTGWRVDGQSAWLWVFATLQVTVYWVDSGRDSDIVVDMLGADFAGKLISDGLPALDSLTYERAQCLGHLVRRAAQMELEQKRGAVHFPRAVKQLLQAAIVLAHRHDELTKATLSTYRCRIERRMDNLLAGRIDNPDNLRLWNHLLTHRHQLFVSLKDRRVSPTNNLAEQQLRGAVVTRKIGGCNREWEHAHAHAVLASIAQTAHRNGGQLTEFVGDWLRPSTGPPPAPWQLPAFKRLGLTNPTALQ